MNETVGKITAEKPSVASMLGELRGVLTDIMYVSKETRDKLMGQKPEKALDTDTVITCVHDDLRDLIVVARELKSLITEIQEAI